ncbi:type IVB secretion system protein IcmH/DotU [Geoalkalibacter halelectricus]|uniref:Type IVB secretion system protein IcmH/DotU n=1 Tax=Geoalkalibacter halelectricus TaxID=2847045 RepID=A0ABY5ZQW2_9BACT|nr:type IVB secretion system protein IcmH/DotU [Geoalkalibacter halelectricus]MDO3379315.1 type IVB secretion system protein IcmH/DotU [Geoalkalibacter halelectricus]MDO3379319.1 type IVB secretion system protein IcmH/DotU [Geoalkalibacter halelectricus]UWZ81071.1 type IVB secretion system protein IcmH/DotU [Geoalkalibacter halelectricus]
MEVQKGSDRVNALLECSQMLFTLVAPLRGGAEARLPGEDFREQILAGFDEMERMAFERQIGMVILKDAKYALAAFVDEAVMSSAWSGRLAWMSRPLQLEMFGDHVAGEGFFERLSQLRQGGEANLDLIELYYVCLQLGFEGIYKVRGLEQLMALQVDLRSQIEGYRGVADPRLAPQGVPREGLFTRVRREVPYWVVAVVTVAVIFFGYLGYAYTINRMAGHSVVHMEAEGRAVKQMAMEQRRAPVAAKEVEP